MSVATEQKPSEYLFTFECPDRLGILAGRTQWVKNDSQRQSLQQQVNDLWSVAGAAE